MSRIHFFVKINGATTAVRVPEGALMTKVESRLEAAFAAALGVTGTARVGTPRIRQFISSTAFSTHAENGGQTLVFDHEVL